MNRVKVTSVRKSIKSILKMMKEENLFEYSLSPFIHTKVTIINGGNNKYNVTVCNIEGKVYFSAWELNTSEAVGAIMLARDVALEASINNLIN